MRPAFKITVNGSDITGIVNDRLVSLTVTDEAGVKSDRVEIVLDDRDQRLAIPPRGATMSVQLGYTDRLVDKGTYTVEEVEVSGPERLMVLRANAVGASKGAGAAKERSWDDTTLGAIASSIASRRGWTPAVSKDLAEIRIEHIDQHENDLQFLSRLAADNGAVAKVVGGRLIMAPHGEAKTVSGKEMTAVTVLASDVSDWSLMLTTRGNYKGVKAVYHDLDKAQRGEAIAGEDTDNTHNLPHTYATKAAAERAAKAKLKSVQRGKDKFSITSMPGNPLLVAETKLIPKGFRAGVDDLEWSVITVTHRITDGGYICSVETEAKV
jgi:uncharacterized protein